MIINKDHLIGAGIGAAVTAVAGGTLYGIVKAVRVHKAKKKIKELNKKINKD